MKLKVKECTKCGWKGSDDERATKDDGTWTTYICPECSCESFYNTNEELKTRPVFEKLANESFQGMIQDDEDVDYELGYYNGCDYVWTTHVEPLQAAVDRKHAVAVDLMVKNEALQSENQKLREQLEESKFVLQWHLDNSKPDSQIYQEDFFNLTANAISQADKLLKTKTNP